MSNCIQNHQSVPKSTMKEEISAAVLFLTRLIAKNEKLEEGQVETFQRCLHEILMERFKDHWFPDTPCKGQAYRCIRINQSERHDPILNEAALRCGLCYDDLKLPVELTIWVDPLEVCCRFGEHKGSYCTVASFRNGNKENFVDKINIEDLEYEHTKKSNVDRIVKRKKSLKKNNNSLRKPNQNLTNGAMTMLTTVATTTTTPSSTTTTTAPTTTNHKSKSNNINNSSQVILQQLPSPPVVHNFQKFSMKPHLYPPPVHNHGFHFNNFGANSQNLRPFYRPQFTNGNVPPPQKYVRQYQPPHPPMSFLQKSNFLPFYTKADKFPFINRFSAKQP